MQLFFDQSLPQKYGARHWQYLLKKKESSADLAKKDLEAFYFIAPTLEDIVGTTSAALLMDKHVSQQAATAVAQWVKCPELKSLKEV